MHFLSRLTRLIVLQVSAKLGRMLGRDGSGRVTSALADGIEGRRLEAWRNYVMLAAVTSQARLLT